MSLLWILTTLISAEKLTYAAGYIPNIQFAPFYVAQHRGYYAEENLEIVMDYTMGSDITKLVALGRVQIASADPDAFLHAAVQKLPIVHVATLYQNYPIALIASKPILNSKGLNGKRIGVSGTFGSSYLGLQNILADMSLRQTDVRVVPIGYNQVASLRQGVVDAVVGYLNNEPVRLRSMGLEIHTRVPEAGSNIPGVGLMTSRKFKEQNPELVEGFLRATFRGMDDVVNDPDGCFALVVEHFLPELKLGERYEAERKILEATLPYWRSDYTEKNGYGQCPESEWSFLATRLAEDRKKTDYRAWPSFVDRSFTWKP